MNEAMNSTLTSGTPRTISMKATLIDFTIGRRERRPSASAMAIGKEPAMPPSASMRVSGSPPHRSVGTKESPGTPPRINTMIAATPTAQPASTVRKPNRSEAVASTSRTASASASSGRHCSA